MKASVAATAARNNMILVSCNAKPLRSIQGLKLKVFKP
jgi:predicted nucleic acid-binding protein